MRRVLLGLWVGAVLAALVALTFRQRALNQLHAANAGLRQQLAVAAASQPAAPAPTSPVTPSATPAPAPAVAPLTGQEQSELLRLRGQIQPLRRELASLSNQLSDPVSPKAAPARRGVPDDLSPAEAARIRALQAYARAQNQAGASRLGQALVQYLAQNDRQLPADLAQLQGLVPDLSTNLFQSFELMRTGQVSTAEQAYTLVARAQAPQPLGDGRWARAYLRANGVLVCATLYSPDGWADWEARAPQAARQRLAARARATASPQ